VPPSGDQELLLNVRAPRPDAGAEQSSLLLSGTLEPGFYRLGFTYLNFADPDFDGTEFPFHFRFDVAAIPLPPMVWPAACLAGCVAHAAARQRRRRH
jgi:hypothetical protein